MMVMTGRAPDVGGNVPGSLEPLRQAGTDQPVERAKDGSPADVGMLPADPVVELLGRGLFPGLLEYAGNGDPLGRQPNARLYQGVLGGSLNHSQMILRPFPLAKGEEIGRAHV